MRDMRERRKGKARRIPGSSHHDPPLGGSGPPTSPPHVPNLVGSPHATSNH